MISEEQKAQREKVMKYLSLYRIIQIRIEQLNNRLKELENDDAALLKSVSYSITPKGKKESTGAAGYLYLKENIIEQINNELNNKYQMLIDIQEVIKAIPYDKIERLVLEYFIIDGLSNDSICKKMYWSYASNVNYHKQRAVDMIIKNDASMKIINDYFNKNNQMQ